VARKSALESEISTTLKAFYCTLCDKQFKNVAQYDEHTNSYAHHHKARFKDMQANVRLKPKEEVDKRKEKERKREERELRKIAAANGIKMAKPSVTPAIPLDAAQASSSIDVDSNPPAPTRRAGWATLSTGEPVKQGGWAAVPLTPAAGPAPQSHPTADVAPSSSGHPGYQPSAPSFRTAGWTSLDTGSSQPMPSQTSEPTYAPPPISQPSQRGDGWNSLPPSTMPAFQPPPPSQPPAPPPVATPVQSAWQQLQKSTARKR
jgi:hypothetical protein